jgi:hypothetical protein
MKFKKPTARPKQWSVEEKDQLAKLAKRGFAASDIAAILRRHTTSVRRMARDMKIFLRKQKRAARQGQGPMRRASQNRRKNLIIS